MNIEDLILNRGTRVFLSDKPKNLEFCLILYGRMKQLMLESEADRYERGALIFESKNGTLVLSRAVKGYAPNDGESASVSLDALYAELNGMLIVGSFHTHPYEALYGAAYSIAPSTGDISFWQRDFDNKQGGVRLTKNPRIHIVGTKSKIFASVFHNAMPADSEIAKKPGFKLPPSDLDWIDNSVPEYKAAIKQVYVKARDNLGATVNQRAEAYQEKIIPSSWWSKTSYAEEHEKESYKVWQTWSKLNDTWTYQGDWNKSSMAQIV